jgi:hypothetical protein
MLQTSLINLANLQSLNLSGSDPRPPTANPSPAPKGLSAGPLVRRLQTLGSRAGTAPITLMRNRLCGAEGRGAGLAGLSSLAAEAAPLPPLSPPSSQSWGPPQPPGTPVTCGAAPAASPGPRGGRGREEKLGGRERRMFRGRAGRGPGLIPPSPPPSLPLGSSQVTFPSCFTSELEELTVRGREEHLENIYHPAPKRRVGRGGNPRRTDPETRPGPCSLIPPAQRHKQTRTFFSNVIFPLILGSVSPYVWLSLCPANHLPTHPALFSWRTLPLPSSGRPGLADFDFLSLLLPVTQFPHRGVAKERRQKREQFGASEVLMSMISQKDKLFWSRASSIANSPVCRSLDRGTEHMTSDLSTLALRSRTGS